MSTTKVFLRGAAVLALATVISKALGSVYTVLLQNMVGDLGMGLYNMAYPIYSSLLLISTAGFPVAVSKFVSEYVALGELRTSQRIYHVSLLLLACIGFAGALALYALAPAFAQLSGDPRAVWAIRAIAPALFVVPALSAMRGYFQGWQMMEPTGVSQVVEQLVRVATILVAASLALRLGFGAPIAAAGAAFGAVSGALAGLVVMLYFFWRQRRREVDRVTHGDVLAARVVTLGYGQIIRKLLYYAVPVSLGALVIPVMSNVDAFTVTNLLKQGGLSQILATRDYGILSGRAFKLMMFPAALASSIGVALMPAVSEAHSLRHAEDTSARALMGLRMTLLFALPASVGLCLLAKPIDVALFRDTAGYHSIQILGLATLFSTVQIALAASLQGMGAVYLPLRSLVFGVILKVLLNLALVPRFGIDGAAAATVASYALAAALNFVALQRLLRLQTPWRMLLLKPLLATFVMSAFTFSLYVQWQRWHVPVPARFGAAIVTVLCVALAGVIYLVALLGTGGLVEGEVESLPRIGRPLAGILRRLRLFPG